jgi:hypothetical protein
LRPTPELAGDAGCPDSSIFLPTGLCTSSPIWANLAGETFRGAKRCHNGQQ